MITKTMHERCGDLLAAYPLALSDHNTMVLMTAEGREAKFFILNCASGRGCYQLLPWRTRDVFDIDAETWDIPAWVTDVITHGVPLPRHGSMFGWKCGKDIAALTVAYTQYEPEHPVPNFMLMPLVGLPESQWPPFAGEHLFGQWFWDHHRAGRLVSVAGLIAGSRDTVFWVAPEGATAGSVAVRAAVSGKCGTLQRGVYAYQGDLRARKPGRSLDVLLADPGKTDLAPRFRRMAEASR
jgi:hypothetical protein